jgi:hypothetical protein
MPCPHCGKPNDFRELDNVQCLDTGSTMVCDHCNRKMVICVIRVIKVMQAKPIRDGEVVRPALGAAPATTISYRDLRRLR